MAKAGFPRGPQSITQGAAPSAGHAPSGRSPNRHESKSRVTVVASVRASGSDFTQVTINVSAA